MSDSSAKKPYFAATLHFTGALFFATQAYTAYLKAETFERTMESYVLVSKNPASEPAHTEGIYKHLTHQTKHPLEDTTNALSLVSLLFFVSGYRILRNGRNRDTVEQSQPVIL